MITHASSRPVLFSDQIPALDRVAAQHDHDDDSLARRVATLRSCHGIRAVHAPAFATGTCVAIRTKATAVETASASPRTNLPPPEVSARADLAAAPAPKPFDAIPRVPTLPVLGAGLDFARLEPKNTGQKFHEVIKKLSIKYGPIVQVRMPGEARDTVLVTEADMKKPSRSFTGTRRTKSTRSVVLALHYSGCLRVPADPNDVRTMQPDFGPNPQTVPLQTMLVLYASQLDHTDRLQYILRLAHYASWVQDAPQDSPATGVAPAGNVPDTYLPALGLADRAAYLSTIVHAAADRARHEYRLDAAIYLYAQCHAVCGVLSTLNARVARAIVQGPAIGAPDLATVLAETDHVLRHFSAADVADDPVASASRATAELLRHVVALHVLASAGTAEADNDAWRALETCALVPTVPLESSAALAAYAARLARAAPEVTPCVPAVLRVAMELAVRRFRASGDAALRAVVRQVRVLAGMVPIKMDAALHAYLAQKEVEATKAAAGTRRA
ncbi:hypothetical protein GGF31_002614 [Allomyces arbusculus]|nr:hypothetical protein GGF31_002614 [Allomyces arbusculus]